MHNPQWVFFIYKSDINRHMKDGSKDGQWIESKYNKHFSIKILTPFYENKKI